MDHHLDTLHKELSDAVDDLERTRSAAAHAHAVLVAACDDPKRGADRPRLRTARAAARRAFVEASTCAAKVRDRLLAAEARQRLEDEACAAREAEDERQAAHLARVAPYVAAVVEARALVEARDRRTCIDAGAIGSIIAGEIAAEALEHAIDELAQVEPENPAIAPARARAASMLEPAVRADLAALSKLVAVVEREGADVARAQAALAERAWSKRTWRWHRGNSGRAQELLALAAPGVAFVANQLHGVEVTRQGLWVRTGPGLAQCHKLPDGVRHRSELTAGTSADFDGPWSPPVDARASVALFFGIAADDADALALIPAIRPHASQAAA